MTARLATHVVVGALRRRADAAGGRCTVVARGDDAAGGLVLVLRDRGAVAGLIEGGTDLDGRYRFRASGPPPPLTEPDVDGWVARRRASDRDLWVVELDIADGERFAAETISAD